MLSYYLFLEWHHLVIYDLSILLESQSPSSCRSRLPHHFPLSLLGIVRTISLLQPTTARGKSNTRASYMLLGAGPTRFLQRGTRVALGWRHARHEKLPCKHSTPATRANLSKVTVGVAVPIRQYRYMARVRVESPYRCRIVMLPFAGSRRVS